MNDQKTALITGGSVGIGFALAHQFAKNGYDLILIARNEAKLKEAKGQLEKQYGVTVKIIVKDLAQHGAPQDIFGELREHGIEIDVLVNNAGVGLHGFFHDTEIKKQLDVIDINIRALTHLTHLFLPEMIKRKSGKILNVASTAAFQSGPKMATYFATKAYVLSFTEALANEIKGSRVTTTVLCPGPTESEFAKRSGEDGTRLMTNKSWMMSADAVAAMGYAGLMKGKSIVIPGKINKFLVILTRFVPRGLATKISRALQEKNTNT